MTTIRVSLLQGDTLRQGDVSLIDEWRRDTADLLWVDIQEPVHEVIEPLLEQRFGFHELAAEDTLSPNTLPKYDAFPTYDFFIFRTVSVDVAAHASETTKIAAFLGKNFLFTVHRPELREADDVFKRLPSDRRLLSRGPDFLLYSIVDEMVDAYFPLLEQIEVCVDDLQDRIFENADESHLNELLHLKRDIN